MSYTWTNGELITAAKLNSTGGVFVVTVEDGTLDKTWQEIWDAAEAMNPVFIREYLEEDEAIYFETVIEVSHGGGTYNVQTANSLYNTQAVDDYPVLD